MYPPTERNRERLLLSGGPKTGKTAGLLSIAEMLAKGDSGAKVFWFDSEGAIWDSAEVVDPLVGSGMMTVTQGSSYHDFEAFVKMVMGDATDHDWVMVDKADAFWGWTQKFYSREVKGKDLNVAIREANKAGENVGWGGVSHVIDRSEWKVVTDYYDDVMLQLILPAEGRPHLHLAFTTEVKDLTDEDAEGLKAQMRFGVKPTGQKGLPFQMRTLVYLEALRGQGHMYSTVERHGSGRPNEERVPFTNFALGYLMSKARWTRKSASSTGGPGSPTTGEEATPGHSDLLGDGPAEPVGGAEG